jgi:hypothetical protein
MCLLLFLCIPIIVVWNIKSQEQRFVDLIPNETWGGAGLLGVTIRMDNYGGADERLIRVLSVQHNSPASIAGLVPLQDFLLGTTVVAFGTTEVLASVLNHHVDKVVEMYVYNAESDVVRVVALMPTFSWGGKGMLGAQVGTGYLHRLPDASRKTIGTSVERKIRWIHKDGEGGDADGDADVGALATEPDALIAMEPHLEMEQVTRDANETHKQPHELGSSPSPDTTSTQRQKTTAKKHQQKSETAEPTEQNTKATIATEQKTGNSSGGGGSSSSNEVIHATEESESTTRAASPSFPAAMPLPHLSHYTIPPLQQSPSTDEVVDVFSGPPPDAAAAASDAAAGFGFLPPPPIMHT